MKIGEGGGSCLTCETMCLDQVILLIGLIINVLFRRSSEEIGSHGIGLCDLKMANKKGDFQVF